jgi:hypothetical protein
MGFRKFARCPNCNSLERHRFVTIFLESIKSEFPEIVKVLDVAPSAAMTEMFLRNFNKDSYIRMDADPSADQRDVDLVASLTQVPLTSGSQDLIYCSHVLEHIVDDVAAIKELSRLSSNDSLVLIQVPHKSDVPTDEGLVATEEERLTRFGQADHVRYYGYDFTSRLTENGLDVVEVNPVEVLSTESLHSFALQPIEPLFICKRKGSNIDLNRFRESLLWKT